MKGWVAQFREWEKQRASMDSARIERFRRRHVQFYRKGFKGFCATCGIVLGEGAQHAKGCLAANSNRRLTMTDWEPTTMQVEVNGTKYTTEATGWCKRVVRGEEFYTKSLKDGVIALLHRIEAAQKGVVIERKALDSTSALPSAPPSGAGYTPVRRVVEEAERPKPRPQLTAGSFTAGDAITREAQRLSDRADKAEAMRKRHVAKHSK